MTHMLGASETGDHDRRLCGISLAPMALCPFPLGQIWLTLHREPPTDAQYLWLRSQVLSRRRVA